MPNSKGKPFKKYSSNNLIEVGNFGTVRILENKNNLGLAWFSESTTCLRDKTETAAVLNQKDYNPRKNMFRDCPPGESVANRELGSVNVLSSAADELKIDVDTPVDNYLHISMANYPGWKVYVDGNLSDLSTSNLALMSVWIIKGKHQVDLRYRPASFTLGMALSLVTLFGWALFYLPKLLKR